MLVKINLVNYSGNMKRISRTERDLVDVPSNLIDRTAKYLNKSIKARASLASRWAKSGDMAKYTNVKVIDKDTIEVVSSSRSAYFQEKGFDEHYIHKSMLSKTAQDAMAPGIQFIKVKKSTPFIQPALDTVHTHMDTWMYDELKAI